MGGIWWDYNHPQLVSKMSIGQNPPGDHLESLINRSFFSQKVQYFQVLDTTRPFLMALFQRSPGGGRHGLRQQRGQRRAGGLRDAGCLEGQRQGHETWPRSMAKWWLFTRFFLVKSMGMHYMGIVFFVNYIYFMRFFFWLEMFFLNQSLGIGIICYYLGLYCETDQA